MNEKLLGSGCMTVRGRLRKSTFSPQPNGVFHGFCIGNFREQALLPKKLNQATCRLFQVISASPFKVCSLLDILSDKRSQMYVGSLFEQPHG
ncbi:MAG: hypothetical protein SFX18_02715 [Pirellulales bacterium]|nr:hypothetical protein [Pirellulales bacterium]